MKWTHIGDNSSAIRPLGALTWGECRSDVLVVPLGATEQHGPHLPLQVDSTIAEAVAEALVAQARSQGKSLVLAPPQRYGASGEHEDFPGTLSIGTEALTLLLSELGRSASKWVQKIVIVNGHGGNIDALKSAYRYLKDENIEFGWVPCEAGMRQHDHASDLHAGHMETSLMLAIQPETVLMDSAEAGVVRPFQQVIGDLRSFGVRAVSPNGVLGDPREASAEFGYQYFDQIVENSLSRVNSWKPSDTSGMLML